MSVLQIPGSIQAEVESVLFAPIKRATSVQGGDISEAFKIELEDGQAFFLKFHKGDINASKSVFIQEAKGLNTLRAVNTSLVIPEVISHNNSYLLLEYLEEEKQGNDFQFGVDIAKLHKSSNELFGFSEDNYIGPIDQSNRYHADWLEFFIRERIEPLANKAMENGLLNNKYKRIFERVFNYTYAIFPDEPPALLHGDLWSGNYLYTKQGQAAIYDPAVYYGHREMELAMTALFGGFNPAFYDGYQTEYPLQTGWEERQKLCQLYPLLVHALLFGGNYVQQSKALLDRFF